ncbi:putative DNA primase large subunit [Blattamonas nauphoetae]|uniref:DNA primase large subunit n=1 Tax=Blattamonas nauphoetae TaxID=2049346 RepID=A0ABQ9WTX6_9EUKA|nr:putative DNA primase large subunit [Blattamonas nauphoetae]
MKPRSRLNPNAITLTKYDSIPTDILGLNSFYELGYARSLLHRRLSEEKITNPNELVDLYNRLLLDREFQAIFTKQGDINSHWILRLASAQSPETENAFIQNETKLFQIRYLRTTKEDRDNYMKDNGIEFEQLSEEHFRQLIGFLQFYPVYGQGNAKIPLQPHREDYYKVPWEQCPHLIEARKVLLFKGDAYVHTDYLVTPLAHDFEVGMRELSKRALNIYERIPLYDARLIDPLRAMVRRPQTALAGSDVPRMLTNETIEVLAPNSFPPCMLNLYLAMRTKHHLKYTGRVHFQLFLKGCQMNLEECLAFFRSEFSQSVGDNKFDREYAYGIRYNYGLEGKRQNWQPKNCNAIIRSLPGGDETHGCPFTFMDKKTLDGFLREGCCLTEKDGSNDIEDIMGHVFNDDNRRDCHLACSAYFRAKHDNTDPFAITPIESPNQYYSESLKYNIRKQKKKDEEEKAKNEKEAAEKTSGEIKPTVGV